MNSDLHPHDPTTWAHLHFSHAQLGDPRRVARTTHIAAALARTPGSSIPKLFTHAHDVKAAYGLFNMNQATPQNLQAGHQAITHAELHQPGTYLLIEDGSEFTWNDTVARAGLGRMHNGRQGFVLHTTLAVTWNAPEPGQTKRDPVRVLGLAHQEFHARVPRPEVEPNQASHARKKRPRESHFWQRSGLCLGDAPTEVNTRWVRVADRGADIEFFLRDCQTRAHGFVVRAAQNRVLVNAEGQLERLKLFEVARAQAHLGQFELELRARGSKPARVATLSVSATRVHLRSTYQPGHASGTQPALPCSLVRVWEANPPEGVDGLEWVLLCDRLIDGFDQAFECGLQYAARWLVEEYHKCLKTGLGADDLQLETGPRLFAAISLMGVVAVRLLALKERVRCEPDAPASASGFSSLELDVLAAVLDRELRCVRDVALGLGRLGGHMNRKGDGFPGWQTLWAGVQRLEGLVAGVRLARKIKTCGE